MLNDVILEKNLILLLPTVLNQHLSKEWYPFCIGALFKTSTFSARISQFSVNKSYILNTIILYQNILCATGIDNYVILEKNLILLLPTVLNQYLCKEWYPFCIGALFKMSAFTARISQFSVNRSYILNTIILYQNILCATGIDYLACIRKKVKLLDTIQGF